MPRPDFTNRGSPKACLRRSRVWLTADWVTPRRTAARDTLPSSRTATNVARDRRSRLNISTGFMGGSLKQESPPCHLPPVKVVSVRPCSQPVRQLKPGRPGRFASGQYSHVPAGGHPEGLIRGADVVHHSLGGTGCSEGVLLAGDGQ